MHLQYREDKDSIVVQPNTYTMISLKNVQYSGVRRAPLPLSLLLLIPSPFFLMTVL